MEVRFFLRERLAFLRQLYSASTAPFMERKRRIDAKEVPFDNPPYDDSGEPAFVAEWLEAEESTQVLGRACISMLSSTLHLYFKTWQKLINKPIDVEMRPIFKKSWLHGYKAYFAKHANVPFEACPVNLELLEEVILARNRVQHPDSITTVSSSYSEADLARIRHPFFVDEREFDMFGEVGEEERKWMLPPSIKITPEKFEAAVQAVERFAEWMETVELR